MDYDIIESEEDDIKSRKEIVYVEIEDTIKRKKYYRQETATTCTGEMREIDRKTESKQMERYEKKWYIE